MNSAGRLIVLAAPAGGGKTTVIKRLRAAHPEWGFSCSATTRAPRPDEVHGRDYYFFSRDEFLRRAAAGEFLEYEDVHGNQYGTLLAPTRERLAAGETLIFDLDVKGALKVKRFFPAALTIFLLPPSREALRARLEGRGTEPPDVMAKRLARADMELALAPQFDARVVNDDLEATVTAVAEMIAAWRQPTPKQN